MARRAVSTTTRYPPQSNARRIASSQNNNDRRILEKQTNQENLWLSTRNIFPTPLTNTSCAPGGRQQPCSQPPQRDMFLSAWTAGVPLAQKGGNYWGMVASFSLVASKDALHPRNLRLLRRRRITSTQRTSVGKHAGDPEKRLMLMARLVMPSVCRD